MADVDSNKITQTGNADGGGLNVLGSFSVNGDHFTTVAPTSGRSNAPLTVTIAFQNTGVFLDYTTSTFVFNHSANTTDFSINSNGHIAYGSGLEKISVSGCVYISGKAQGAGSDTYLLEVINSTTVVGAIENVVFDNGTYAEYSIPFITTLSSSQILRLRVTNTDTDDNLLVSSMSMTINSRISS